MISRRTDMSTLEQGSNISRSTSQGSTTSSRDISSRTHASQLSTTQNSKSGSFSRSHCTSFIRTASKVPTQLTFNSRMETALPEKDGGWVAYCKNKNCGKEVKSWTWEALRGVVCPRCGHGLSKPVMVRVKTGS